MGEEGEEEAEMCSRVDVTLARGPVRATKEVECPVLARLVIGQKPWHHVSLYGHHPSAVGALDLADLGFRLALDEITDRDSARRRLGADMIELADSSIRPGIAHANVDLIIRIVRTIFAEFDAGGHQLH